AGSKRKTRPRGGFFYWPCRDLFLASGERGKGEGEGPFPAKLERFYGVRSALRLAVGVAEVAFRVDHVPHELLEAGGVGETAVALALPDQLALAGDGEDAAGAGHQRHFAEFGT